MNHKIRTSVMSSMPARIDTLCRYAIDLINAIATRLRTLTAAACVLCLLGACGGGGGGAGGGGSVTYTLGGTLSGLADGQMLVLSNGNETLTRSTNGTFSFATALASGSSYEVRVSGQQPAWQTCSVSNGTGSANANVSNVAVTCISADSAATGLLNDTGIDWCSENITTPSTWVNNAVCSAVNWAANLWGLQQDAFFGRDAQAKEGALPKVGAGMAGFDFTKIGASGKVLTKQGEAWSDTGTEAASTQWDCVRDNVTGLVWEVKRNDPTHLRHFGHGYVWYNPDSLNNGGDPGFLNSNTLSPTCTGVADLNQCNTHSYVTAVNAAGLCGKQDWRLPTLDELRGLAHMGHSLSPSIDINYFPNTSADYTWSALPMASSSDMAWSVRFFDGGYFLLVKSEPYPVRLVRSMP